ncbi:DUF742 domain-containing protein [Streptomyces sp. NPDC021212]|uniref:DUF742 domain-containing protein n=1 Tax=Streptomyces sp. NPDC021212 TaxID=3365118 RepID=UPI0037BA95A2
MVTGEPGPHETATDLDGVAGVANESISPDAPEPTGRASAIRPFLLTAGRVAGGGGTGAPLPVEAQVVTTSDGLSALRTLAFERHDIVAACRRPQSVAELSARLRLHLNVVRVLAEDLCTAGHLVVHVPDARTVQDISVLRRVIDGLRAVPDSRGTLRDSS